jgi:PilZ domain
MGDTLARVFEYRVLYAKHRELQIPLTEEEQTRFGMLRRELPTHVPNADERDVFTLLDEPLAAQYVAAGEFESGILRNASAIGLAIETTGDPPKLGQRLVVHVQEPDHGVEYVFPCRVIARIVAGTPSMAVVFDGVPAQTRALGRASGVFASDDEEPDDTQFEEERDTAKMSQL